MAKEKPELTSKRKEAARLYDDIIKMKRPELKHMRMDRVQRAKIFAPYDALTGFDDEIAASEETHLETTRISLSEDEISKLSDQLAKLQKGMNITIEYFIPGTSENSGFYVTARGAVEKVDPVSQSLDLDLSETTSEDTAGRLDKTPPLTINFSDISALF